MNRPIVIAILLLVALGVWWVWERPTRGDVDVMQGHFARTVCDTEAVFYFARNVGKNDVQAVVGPDTQRRGEVFARVKQWLAAAGTTHRQRVSYRKLVACDADEMAQFDQAVTAEVGARCPQRRTELLPGLLTLLGVVAQDE